MFMHESYEKTTGVAIDAWGVSSVTADMKSFLERIRNNRRDDIFCLQS
jgi:hypothetical protein